MDRLINRNNKITKNYRKENFEGLFNYILLINEKGKFATN